MYRLIALLIGYVFGCIQTGYFLSKKTAGIDIREHGSGGAGFTNVTRVLGFKRGVIVLIADIAKAVLAFLLAVWLLGCRCGECNHPGLYAGFGVILGHNFPFYLRFRGGKGVASTLGLIFLLDWRAALIIYGAMLLIIAMTRYISVASLGMSVMIPVMLAVFGHSWETVAVTGALGALAWFMHRKNIIRLARGEESKFNFGRKKLTPAAQAPHQFTRDTDELPLPTPEFVSDVDELPPPTPKFASDADAIPPSAPGFTNDADELPPSTPNKGKKLIIEYNGVQYYRYPIRTHLIDPGDTVETGFVPYLAPHVRTGDIVFISERAVACTQNRAVRMVDIKPRRLAVFLSRYVQRTPHGIGLGIPETMEMALRECGTPRILLAAAVSVIGKLFRRKGWFYRVAGARARGIDGPCPNTIAPYNEYVVLTPDKPNTAAHLLAEKLGVTVAIVDANDIGCNVLGASDKTLAEAFIAGVLRDNPMGQSGEQTPCGIIRRALHTPPTKNDGGTLMTENGDPETIIDNEDTIPTIDDTGTVLMTNNEDITSAINDGNTGLTTSNGDIICADS